MYYLEWSAGTFGEECGPNISGYKSVRPIMLLLLNFGNRIVSKTSQDIRLR